MNEERPLQSKSASLYERAKKVLPGGCSRNTILRSPHPDYVAYGKGCYVTDIEGTERIDFANNMCSLIHGHAHPAVISAVSEQLQKGTAFTLATEAEILYAEHLCSRSDGFEKVRFVNSGSEAIICCLKAARAFTSKPKIAKVEGAYHGVYDYAEISQTAAPSNWGDADSPESVPVAYGTPQSTLDDVIILPFNDPEAAVAILDKHKDDIACVLMDLMPHRVGLTTATEDYYNALYNWTRANQSLLVADEVITYRSEYGGLQSRYKHAPDLTAMGKLIGGGFPVGAIAGRGDIMDVMNPLSEKVLFPHSGTFSANPITMIAGRLSMELFDKEAAATLNELGEYTRSSLRQAIKNANVEACVTGTGSMFRIHMKATPPTNYRQSYMTASDKSRLALLLDHLHANGMIMIGTGSGALSTAMGKIEIDRLTEEVEKGLRLA